MSCKYYGALLTESTRCCLHPEQEICYPRKVCICKDRCGEEEKMKEIKIKEDELFYELVGKSKKNIYLDMKCAFCERNSDPCPVCDGTGYLPTDAGKAILELVKRYK